jgi:endonuclease/exonuclease/phosphatase family metal-dependent hydrolase
MSHHIPLSKAGPSDRSPRELLHIQIEYEHHEIFFMVVHFSTDKKIQCQNAMRVINFIASTGADRTVIAGDFNTYSDYEWPVEAVLNGFFLPNGCPKPVGFEPIGAEQGYGFDDSWSQTSVHEESGLTFSNMVRLSASNI